MGLRKSLKEKGPSGWDVRGDAAVKGGPGLLAGENTKGEEILKKCVTEGEEGSHTLPPISSDPPGTPGIPTSRTPSCSPLTEGSPGPVLRVRVNNAGSPSLNKLKAARRKRPEPVLPSHLAHTTRGK